MATYADVVICYVYDAGVIRRLLSLRHDTLHTGCRHCLLAPYCRSLRLRRHVTQHVTPLLKKRARYIPVSALFITFVTGAMKCRYAGELPLFVVGRGTPHPSPPPTTPPPLTNTLTV